MDDHTLKLLEYDHLLDLLGGLALSAPGEVYCRSLQPDLSVEAMLASWRLVDEAKELQDLEGPPPLAELPDITRSLKRASVAGLVLKTIELLDILKSAQTSRLVKSYLGAYKHPHLLELAEGLDVFLEIEQEFPRALGPDGQVLDTATPALARIRRDLIALRGSIQNRLTGLMREPHIEEAIQDELVTRRGGRYVIPVKTSQRRMLGGLVHDYSASGATAFIEPLEVVEDNNRINLLRRQEKQEVDRILARLSALVATVGQALAESSQRLARIDGLMAMAGLSRRQKARAPILDALGGLELLSARHPLLLARETDSFRKTVPVDLQLEPDSRVLVVSGINAGGKTVALKTLGLLILMARTGLHLPVAEGSRLPFFELVMAAMGDEQDLQSDLSTFSGHVRRLTWVLSQATDRSLVLLDELGTGTDPAEGAALALAVLDELKDRAAWVMTATHYHLLKAWAHLSPGAKNAAVRTDEAGRPTFGLDYGTPGFSSGLAMTRDLGLEPRIVAKAESYMEEGQKKTLELMHRLEQEKAALTERRVEVESLTEELAAAWARSDSAERRRAESHRREIESLKARVEEKISRAEQEISELKRRLKGQDRPAGEIIRRFKEIKTELKQILPMARPKFVPVREVHIGDRVLIPALGREGRVIAVSPDRGRVEVRIDGMTVQTFLTELARPAQGSERPRRPEVEINLSIPGHVPSEVNLLGLTVDEALPMVEKIIDQATLGGVKKLAIIHGRGTGRLRQAVRGYLKADVRVKGFYRGEPAAGGEGVTVVELQD